MLVTPAAMLTGLLSAMTHAEGTASPVQAVGVLALSLLGTTVVAALERRRTAVTRRRNPISAPLRKRSHHGSSPAAPLGNGVASG